MVRKAKAVTRARFYPSIALVAVLAGAAVTTAWMKPGFVDCTGYLEPEGWIPLYSPGDGLVKYGSLVDGMDVNRGDLLIVLDDYWPLWNLKKLRHERILLETEQDFLNQSLTLFAVHREIEEDELRRLLSTDLILTESSSLSLNELRHSEYLLSTFIAAADREESELKQALHLGRLKKGSLHAEEKLWESRLDECRIQAPVSGRFFCAETLQSGDNTGMNPAFGPGRRIDKGRLLGYLIPAGGMLAHIEIPQNRISVCRPGQSVLLSVDARPQWRYAPVEGRLTSILNVASGGVFYGRVDLSASGQTLGELRDLSCGNLTARIDIRNRENRRAGVGSTLQLSGRIWEWWTLLLN